MDLRLFMPIIPGMYYLPSILYLVSNLYNFYRSSFWYVGLRLNCISLRVCDST